MWQYCAVFLCPYCGRTTSVFPEKFSTMDVDRNICEHCGKEILIVNDIPMTEEEYRKGGK